MFDSFNPAAGGYAKSWRTAAACAMMVMASWPAMAADATTTSGQRAVELPPPARQFLAGVRANFAAWDLNRDGKLTREEIEIDMQNTRITG
jgi:hypothetical protein